MDRRTGWESVAEAAPFSSTVAGIALHTETSSSGSSTEVPMVLCYT